MLSYKYDNQPIEQKLLFHGTRANDPAVIYEGCKLFIVNKLLLSLVDESFDMRLAASGLWGTGIYFAEKSSYSNNYAYVFNILLTNIYY